MAGEIDYIVSQKFNKRNKQYQKLNANEAFIVAMIALMPKGQVVHAPVGVATGTSRAKPTIYSKGKAVCTDKVSGKAYSTFVNFDFVPTTKTNLDIRTACITYVDTPNGTLADNANVSMKRVG